MERVHRLACRGFAASSMADCTGKSDRSRALELECGARICANREIALGCLRVDDRVYLRVSTDKQGEHGYGIAAQRQAVTAYLNGGRWELLGEFVEVESGKRNDRPELTKAIAACKKHKAKLVIAKLDRLARNVHLISGLMESKVDFVCCDMPDANRLTIHILAAVAEHEREMISERTKAGLAAARARGVKLGNQALAEANKAAAAARDASLETVLRDLGGRPYREIAAELTSGGIVSPRGGAWNAMTVMRVMKRLGIANPTSGL
jgi:DNA invertase Pin-like site-specific DNA recombinase